MSSTETEPRRSQVKRETDLLLISDWIQAGQRVLDLGCGRGVLLEHLRQSKHIYGVGVDTDPEKVRACVKRGVNVFQGDALAFLDEIPEGFFDWVVISRTLQELDRPGDVVCAALRAGRHLAVGFANYGFWANRWSLGRYGQRIRNEVFPKPWFEGPVLNPISIRDFEDFCREQGLRITDAVYLAGDWKTRIQRLPNLRAGYAVYSLERASS